MLQRLDLLFLFDPAVVAPPACPSEEKQPDGTGILGLQIKEDFNRSQDFRAEYTEFRITAPLHIPNIS